jgi:Mg2+ and Co2+ transporter CorA
MAQQKSLLPSSWTLPDIFRRRLGEDVGRQRAMFHEGHLLLVLHEPPEPDEVERDGRFFWRKPDGFWVSTIDAPDQTALATHLDEYEAAIDKLDAQEAAARTSQEYFEILQALTPLVRATHNLHETLQEARRLVPDDRQLLNDRDRAYMLARQAEILQTDAKVALDYRIARQAEEQSRSSRQMAAAAHRLNLLAAFFFPMATLTAIFGVNLWLPWEEIRSPVPLAGILAAGLFAGLVLMLFVGRKPR